MDGGVDKMEIESQGCGDPGCRIWDRRSKKKTCGLPNNARSRQQGLLTWQLGRHSHDLGMPTKQNLQTLERSRRGIEERAAAELEHFVRRTLSKNVKPKGPRPTPHGEMRTHDEGITTFANKLPGRWHEWADPKMIAQAKSKPVPEEELTSLVGLTFGVSLICGMGVDSSGIAEPNRATLADSPLALPSTISRKLGARRALSHKSVGPQTDPESVGNLEYPPLEPCAKSRKVHVLWEPEW
ncbi:hypothetical protein R1flu_007783 [Riccia fluitans]|uniref:Uncharacterized protein n=1 Tax=Riccia fluitans TaxID=41844 RepID=A0ABD1YZU2_9MARC